MYIIRRIESWPGGQKQTLYLAAANGNYFYWDKKIAYAISWKGRKAAEYFKLKHGLGGRVIEKKKSLDN